MSEVWLSDVVLLMSETVLPWINYTMDFNFHGLTYICVWLIMDELFSNVRFSGLIVKYDKRRK